MMESHRSSPGPSSDAIMARSCISLSRSNSSSSRKKIGSAFETVNENENETKANKTKETNHLHQQRADLVIFKALFFLRYY